MSATERQAMATASPVSRPRRRNRLQLGRAAAAVASLVVFLAVWEGIIRLGNISPYLVPAPSSVIVSLGQDLLSPVYWRSIYVTLYEILLGFLAGAALGIGLGMALALSPATPAQTLLYLQFPNALPYIFAGLNTAIVLSVIGAIVGEFVGAREGLGVIILKDNLELNLASVFSSLIVLGIIGVLLNGAMGMIERRVCFWTNRDRQ